MAYKGKYRPKNSEKYLGDIKNISFRSLWERQVMKWLDFNSDVIAWSSEEIIIPYLCETDKKTHRYFVDFFFEVKNGNKYLIEVKPYKQTLPPTIPERTKTGRKSRRFLNESMTFVKNQSKWKAARQFAKKNGMVFNIWTEKHLKQMGIKTTRK